MLSLRPIISLVFMIVSVTSLECYANDDWFQDVPFSRKQTYSPQDQLQAVVCNSRVPFCLQRRQFGDMTLLEFGTSEVMSFQCDNYQECFWGDGNWLCFLLNLSSLLQGCKMITARDGATMETCCCSSDRCNNNYDTSIHRSKSSTSSEETTPSPTTTTTENPAHQLGVMLLKILDARYQRKDL